MDFERTRPGPAATIVGDFRLVRELGSGGFGTVYEAVQLKTSMTYAVKRLHKATDPERFKKEAVYPARAAVRSLHVLNTHSFFEGADGSCYIVTDFMRHGDLGTFVATHGPLAIDTVLDIAIGVAKGLAAIHEDGIVHLDLKPVNVLMDRKDDQWIPKIADFGLARSAVSQVQNDGLTVAYASPEHFDTRLNRTSASDMFSFGMLLYELLAGRKACGDATELSRYFTWIKQATPPDPPSRFRPELEGRDDLDVVVANLLAFDVAQRTMTATAVVQALQAARQRTVSGPALTAVPSAPASAAAAPAGAPPRTPVAPVTSAQPSPARGVSRTALLTAALIVVVLVGGAGAWWLVDTRTNPDVPDGLARFKAGAHAEAFRLLLDPARDGDVAAQRTVGQMYAQGLGVPRDPAEARRWLDKAIDQDDAEARCVLADLYRQDGGDEAAVRRLYTEAAATHACGHHGLGNLLTRAAAVLPPGSYDEGLRHYERAVAMGDATADPAMRDLQSEWPLHPLVPGAWQPVVATARRDELARLASEKLLESLKPFDPRRLRRLPLEFYDQAELLELEVGRGAGSVGVVSYLRLAGGAVWLKGQAEPVNRLNVTAPLRIETAQRAMAYLRFYQSAAVQGRSGGLFHLVDEATDVHWLPVAPQEIRGDIARQLVRLRVDASPRGGWLAEGSVFYNASLFRTTYEVSADGAVRVQPKQVTAELPMVVERFDADGVRVALTPAAPTAAPPATSAGGPLERSAARAF